MGDDQGVADVAVPGGELGGVSADGDFGVEADILGSSVGTAIEAKVTPGFALVWFDDGTAIEADVVTPLGFSFLILVAVGGWIIWVIFASGRILWVDGLVLVEEVTVGVAGVGHRDVDVDAVFTGWDLAATDIPRSFDSIIAARGGLGVPFGGRFVPTGSFRDV